MALIGLPFTAVITQMIDIQVNGISSNLDYRKIICMAFIYFRFDFVCVFLAVKKCCQLQMIWNEIRKLIWKNVGWQDCQKRKRIQLVVNFR